MTWLEGETIEQAINVFIHQQKKSDSILCVPTYLYQLAALEDFTPILQFCAAKKALNYDLIIIPFNTDITGCGYHWVLATVNFREREISVFNSIHSLKTLKHAAPKLMKVVACMYTSATETFQASDWKTSDVVNTPQQGNGYDCGVFTVVNACAIIDNTPLGPVNSVKARMWIHTLIEQYEPPKVRRAGLSHEKLQCFKKEVQAVTQTVHVSKADYTGTLKRLDPNSKDWTLCLTSTCKGDPKHRDDYILCIICRRWFHLKCTPSADRLVVACTDYHKCLMCCS